MFIGYFVWRCWTLWLLLEKISLQEQVWDDLCWSQSGNYLSIFSLQFFFWAHSNISSFMFVVCNWRGMVTICPLSFLPLDWACQIVLICWTVTKHHEKKESCLVCHLIDRQTLITLSSLFCTQLVLLYMSEVHVRVVLFTAGHCEEFVIRNSSCP